jgi:hypothetical protein
MSAKMFSWSLSILSWPSISALFIGFVPMLFVSREPSSHLPLVIVHRPGALKYQHSAVFLVGNAMGSVGISLIHRGQDEEVSRTRSTAIRANAHSPQESRVFRI